MGALSFNNHFNSFMGAWGFAQGSAYETDIWHPLARLVSTAKYDDFHERSPLFNSNGGPLFRSGHDLQHYLCVSAKEVKASA
jgi:hypothetical protein